MSIPQNFDKDQSASVSKNKTIKTHRTVRRGVFTAILAIAVLTIPAIAIGQTYFGLDLVGHVAGSMMPATEAAAPSGKTRTRSLSEYVFSFFSDQNKSRQVPPASPFDPDEVVATDSLAEPPSLDSVKKVASSLVQLNVPSQYGTIQAAINAANPAGGDEIVVAPGTYIEQIIINVPVTITGSGAGQTTIQSPPTLASTTVVGVSDTQSIVEVRAGAYVTMNDLTVSGPVEFDVSTYGIYVTESSTLAMNNARVTAIRKASGVDGSQNGVGVRAGSQAFNKIAGLIFNNVTIDDYQKNGVIVDRAGSTATISNSSILGAGPLGSGFAAQNGIQISTNATALIQGSTISGHEYTPATFAAVGILPIDAGAVTIRNNNLAGNSEGVYAYSAAGIASPLTIENNNFSGSDYGIVAWGVNADIRENLFTNNDISIGAYPTNTNIIGIHSNDITGSSIAAIDVDNHGATPITGAQLSASFNRFGGNVSGLSNATSSNFNAENNFWGCNAGANGGVGCDSAAGIFDADPWLMLTGMVATPTSVNTGGTSTVSGANLRMNSDNVDTFSFPGNPNVRDGLSVSYSVNSFGSIDVASSTFVDGLAIAGTTFTAGGPFNGNQTAVVSATLDAATSDASITVLDAVAPSVTITANGPNPTNNTSITFTAVFSEAVTGLNTAGISLAGTTAGGASVSSVTETGPMDGTTYTVTVTVDGSSNGNVSATVNAGAANDNGSPANPNTGSNTASVGYFAGSLELVVDDAGVNCLSNGAPVYLTIPDAVLAASPGYTIRVCAGTYAMTGSTSLNKAGMTIIAAEATKPTINVTGTGNLFAVSAANVTVDGLNFVKTDTTAQHIFTVQGTGFTAQNSDFTSTTSWESTGTTRAFEVSSTATGLLIDNNTITDFRQPAYLNGGGTAMLGTVSNNTVTRTKGWVVDGAMVNFTGNDMHTCAACDTDIALIPSGATPAVQAFYADRLALSTANNNAHIDVQFTAADDSGRAASFVDATTGSSTNNGRSGSPYASIQQAIFNSTVGIVDGTLPGGTINVAAGTYVQEILVSRTLKIVGADAATTIISGPAGGNNATVRFAATGVELSGFTITREGNNLAMWNDPTLKSAGLAIQSQPTSGALIHDNIFVGNRSAVDINDSSQITIRNNVFDNNHTGVIFRNVTDEIVFVENTVANNRTVGVLFLDASSGSNVPAQRSLNSTFSNNNISGNWYGQVVDRQTGGSLPAPGANLKNFQGNWLGTPTPTTTTANSAEPGYGALIPPVYGGTASAPGGQPDIAGTASANIRYNQTLTSGTDSNIETVAGRGTFGFQGVPAHVNVQSATGWGFFTEGLNGSGGFEVGPQPAPLNLGSARLTVDADGRHSLGTLNYGGIRLDSITKLQYSSYQTSGNAAAAISLQFDVKADLTDPGTGYEGRLVFEPYQTPSNTVLQGQWQNWNALEGRWWGSTGSGTRPITAACPQSAPCTWSAILAAFPNAGIRPVANNGVLLFRAGGPTGSNFEGFVDKFELGINTAETTFDFEPGPPTVTVEQAAGQNDPTNGTTINFTVVFSEPVADFATGDVVLAGTAGATTAVVTEVAPNDGTTYNVAVSGMTSDGTVIASVPAGSATGIGGGNFESTSADNSVTFDGTAPTAVIAQASGQADPTNVSPINFTVIFNEGMTGFDATDVSTAGSTAGIGAISVTPVSATEYTITVPATSSGIVTANVVAGAAQDAAGNANAAAVAGDNQVAYFTGSIELVVDDLGVNCVSNGAPVYTTIQAAVAAAGPGYTIRVCAGDYPLASTVNVPHAGLSIIGAEAAKPHITVGGTMDGFNVTATGVTIQDLEIEKIGTATQHHMVRVTTNGFTAKDNYIHGPSWTSPDHVSRAFVFNAGVTGYLVDGNVIEDLRQPAYTTGGSGTVSNNVWTGTKGWVNDGSEIVFTNNTMTTCAACDTDIALLNNPSAAYQAFYADRLALSASNNNAHIDVQFTAAADSGRAISYVANSGASTNDGRLATPYASIQQAIFDATPGIVDGTLPGGTINVAAGTYSPAGGQILVNRSLSIIGADPNTTIIDGLGVAPATSGLVRLETPVADTGNTTFTGFTVTNPGGTGTKAAILAKPMSPNSTVTINNNRITGMGTTDYGLWAYRPRGPVVFTGNTVTGTGYNPVLIEQALGGSDVSGNTIQSAFGYFNMTYGGENIAALQKVANNSFDNGSVSITSGFGGAAGSFSNIEVTGNTFLNLGAKTAIGIANQSADGVSGEITGAVVTGNRVSGTNAAGSNGVRLAGLITNANVSCNTLIRTENGVQVVSNAGGSPVGATVVDNNFGGNTFGVSNSSTNNVDGTGNFWGSASGPGPVGSGTGVQVSSLVTFSPFATAPVPCAPAMPPTVSLEQASGQNDPTNVASIDFTVTFNEDVAGFDAASDVSLGNATFGSITAVNASTYTLTVTASADGPVTASVVDGAAASVATSELSIASTSADNSVTYDATNPTAVLTYNGVDPTNSTLNFSLAFSEAVTGFDLSDINVVNGTASNLAGSAGSYTFDVTANSNGNVVVDIAAGGATDVAGNTNAASNQITVAFDGSAPSVTILHSAATSSTSPVTFTVTFSEAVTGFDAGDIVLSSSTTGGPLVATVSGTGPSYTVSVSGMSQSGDVVIAVPAGAAVDNASNGNTASTPASPGSDTIAFTVDSTTKVITPANAVSEQWAYYDDVSNAVMPNYDLVYGPATPPLQSGSARLQTPATGPASLLAFGTTAFNGTRLDSITAYSYSAYLASSGLGGGEPTLQFNVDYNLDDADTSYQGRIVYVPSQNGTVTPDTWQDWNALNGLFWGSSTFAPPGMPCTQSSPCTRAQLLASYPNIGIHASAGFLLFRVQPNANANVDRFTIGVNSENTVFDFEPSFPAPTVSYTGPDPTNAGTINFAVTFSEPVTGFGDAASDVTLGGTAGATTAVVTGSGTTYNVAVSGMTGDGSIDVSVPAAAAQGSSSSAPSTASNTASVNYDATGASVTVDQAVSQADPTSTSPVNFTVVFDQPVTGFGAEAGDVIIGGTAGATTAVVTGSGSTYNVAVSGMNASGIVSITVPAGAAQDSLGNPSYASTSTDNTVQFDLINTDIVVNPTAMGNWGLISETATSSGGFVSGPAPAPAGNGSVFFTVNATGGHAIWTRDFAGTRLDQITELRYSTYQNNAGNPSHAVQAVALQFEVDSDVTDTNTAFQGRLVFEPYNTPSNTVQQGVWQEWDPTNGKWWGTGGSGVRPITVACPISAPCDWSTILANFPNAGIRSASAGPTAGGLFLKAGSGWNPGAGADWIGNVDKLVIGINSANATYDFEPTPPTLSVDDVSVAEGNAGTSQMTFTVSISEVSQLPTTVSVSTSDGTATVADSDYVAVTNQTVTIPAGDLSATFMVDVNGDVLHEADETFTVTLSNPVNAAITDGTGTGTITNDEALPTVSISTTSAGAEPSTPATFTVTLSGQSSSQITVDYLSASGSATDGTDYTTASGTLTFAANTTVLTQDISVAVLDDNIVEGSEDFAVNLSNPVNAGLGAATAIGTITDEDTCNYSLAPTSENFPIAGGSSSFGVTVFTGCSWTAVSNAAWITTTSTGDGNGTVNFSVGTNVGGARTGTITVGGQTFTVTQDPAPVNVVIPSNLTGLEGSSILIPVNVTSDTTGRNVISYEFAVHYDPAILTPDVVIADATGTMSSAFAIEATNPTPGVVGVSAVGSNPLSGSGTLLYLRFTVDGTTPACTTLNFAPHALLPAFEFNTGNPADATTNGQFCVVNGIMTGKVTYGNPQPVAAPPSPGPAVPNVAINASGSTPLNTTTNSSGAYSLSGFGNGPYTVTPSKTGGFGPAVILSADASLIQQYRVGAIALTAKQLMAADVDGNGIVQSFDAALIQQWRVGIPPAFGVNNTGTWKFDPNQRTYVDVSTDQANQDYEAYLLGDVDGSWVLFPPSLAEASAAETKTQPVSAGTENLGGGTQPVAIGLPTAFHGPATEFMIPITVSEIGGLNVTSYDIDFTYNPSVIEPVVNTNMHDLTGTISAGMNVVSNKVGLNTISISATRVTPLDGTGTLINLRFRAVGPVGSQSNLNFTLAILNAGIPSSVASNGSISIVNLAPTSAPTSVAGRVVGSKGQAVIGAIVQLTDPSGSVFSGRTNAFGNFRIDGVPTGRTYMIGARAKGLSFGTQAISVQDEIVGLTITALE